jgi:hypothetical protein
MVVDVVVEMDDIDMMLARIEMARDKLTTGRIARSVVQAKGKSKLGLRLRERVNAARFGGETGRRDPGCKNTTFNCYSENCSPLSHRKCSR